MSQSDFRGLLEYISPQGEHRYYNDDAASTMAREIYNMAKEWYDPIYIAEEAANAAA